MRRKCRVIIDTNLWISFLLSKRFRLIDRLLDNGIVELVFCAELLTELVEVASRPKLRKYFTGDDWALVIEIIDRYAIYIPVISSVTLCRDEKDNFLLSLAKDAKADYLLTGDKDLLVLESFGVTKIVTVTDFLTITTKHE